MRHYFECGLFWVGEILFLVGGGELGCIGDYFWWVSG